jgi:hypothetical protein
VARTDHVHEDHQILGGTAAPGTTRRADAFEMSFDDAGISGSAFVAGPARTLP